MTIELPPLPYARNALAPHISERTIDYHYGKHHQGYVNKLNKAIKGTDFAGASLEEIIQATQGDATQKSIFNNAAQIWNHTLYWESMAPGGGAAPDGTLAEQINAAFGDYEGFKAEFKSSGTGQFGSGWTWLVRDGDTLRIESTGNAELPSDDLSKILLTMDVWEHAYYLDHQNERGTYVDVFLDHLVSWENAKKRLEHLG